MNRAYTESYIEGTLKYLEQVIQTRVMHSKGDRNITLYSHPCDKDKPEDIHTGQSICGRGFNRDTLTVSWEVVEVLLIEINSLRKAGIK